MPKEGMPHAHKACQKKRRKEIADVPRIKRRELVQKKEKKKIAPCPERKKKRDGLYKGVHTPSTKNIHTLAHLDQGL